MPNNQNSYLNYVENYVKLNTPVEFNMCSNKYNEIYIKLENIPQINSFEKEIVSACYTLLYITLDYHFMIQNNDHLKPYYILVGDYISSYILELLYKNNLLNIQQIFISNTKKILINKLGQDFEDTLLIDIINYYKG